MRHLHGSVGLGGRNWSPDVVVVQRLLTQAAVSPGPIDGRCGMHTIHAIEHFQKNILRKPDGRVDVGGPSWRRLASGAAQTPHAPATARPSAAGRAAPAGAAHPAPAAARTPPAPPGSAARAAPPAPPPPAAPVGTNVRNFWRAQTPRSNSNDVNRGLTCPRARDMLRLLGDPHDQKAKSHLGTASVGPFSIYGLKPALDSMRNVFANVRRDLPELYGLISHDGMYNVRYIGGTTTWSNHSWGAAIDLKIADYLVPRRAQFSVRGLDALVPYFNAAGWYWGGGYRGNFNDPMHFECGLDLLNGFGL